MKKVTEKATGYDPHIRTEQKHRYAGQGDDIQPDELEEESDPVTEDM